MTGATPVGPGALATGSIPIIRDGKPPREQPDPSVLGVVLTCVVTGMFMIGHYALYTYVAPFLERSSGIPASNLSVALLAYGVAGILGLVLVALVLGKRPAASIPLMMAVFAVSVGGLLVWEGQALLSLIAFVVLGVTFGALPPLFQTRLLQMAPARIRDISNSFYASSFNAGIGAGALVGSVVLTGAGLGTLPRLDIVVAVVMLVAFLISNQVLVRRDRRRKAERRAARAARTAR